MNSKLVTKLRDLANATARSFIARNVESRDDENPDLWRELEDAWEYIEYLEREREDLEDELRDAYDALQERNG